MRFIGQYRHRQAAVSRYRHEPAPGRPWSEAGGQTLESGVPVVTKATLAAKYGEYDIVLANPPFGKKAGSPS